MIVIQYLGRSDSITEVFTTDEIRAAVLWAVFQIVRFSRHCI